MNCSRRIRSASASIIRTVSGATRFTANLVLNKISLPLQRWANCVDARTPSRKGKPAPDQTQSKSTPTMFPDMAQLAKTIRRLEMQQRFTRKKIKEVNRMIDRQRNRKSTSSTTAQHIVLDSKLLASRLDALAVLQHESMILGMALRVIGGLRIIVADQLDDLRDYDHSFSLYYKATRRATELWRLYHPAHRDTIPDTGIMIDWLVDRAGFMSDYGRFNG